MINFKLNLQKLNKPLKKITLFFKFFFRFQLK
jgi:hypothetical protein